MKLYTFITIITLLNVSPICAQEIINTAAENNSHNYESDTITVTQTTGVLTIATGAMRKSLSGLCIMTIGYAIAQYHKTINNYMKKNEEYCVELLNKTAQNAKTTVANIITTAQQSTENIEKVEELRLVLEKSHGRPFTTQEVIHLMNNRPTV